jgi:NAD+ dependent glucose-6-phosphate dehydrogenase
MVMHDAAGTTRRRRVLVTGAAGRIGRAFRAGVGDRYALRLADRRPDAAGDPGDLGGHETMPLDVADPDACRRACAGVDAVVHLAADPSPEADFHGSLLANNVVGTYNIFRAAADAGCRRVVFASSVHAVWGYPDEVQVHPDMPVRPATMYGVSKCFGEAVARRFADQEGVSAICVRIGYFDPREEHFPLDWRDLSMAVTPRDLTQLLVRAIEAEGVPFAIVHGISNNRFLAYDITSARELLGYAPEDDAFELFSHAVPPPSGRMET